MELAVRMALAVLGTWVAYDVLRGLVWPLLPDWARTLAIPAVAALVLIIPWPLAREALAVAGVVALIRRLTTAAEVSQIVLPGRHFQQDKGLKL